MSHDESSAIEAMRQTIRWLIGGIGALLLGAMTVGAWVAKQEGNIASLQEADRLSLADRAGLHGEIKAHGDTLNMIQQNATGLSKDVQYIKESVTEIKRVLTK